MRKTETIADKMKHGNTREKPPSIYECPYCRNNNTWKKDMNVEGDWITVVMFCPKCRDYYTCEFDLVDRRKLGNAPTMGKQ